MITRRRFIQTSMAASALAFSGCRNDSRTTAAAGGNAELRLYFVGGSVFVQNGHAITALQLSGKGQSHNGHSLEHASYIAGPPELFPTGVALPAQAVFAERGFGGFKAVCLSEKKVTVTSSNKGANKKCKKLVDYGHVATEWVRKGSWDPKTNPAIHSMFTLNDGDLVDDKAVNQNGEKVKWWVKDRNKMKDVSDVAYLDLKAAEIVISGLTNSDIVLAGGTTLALAVFSGPLQMHEQNHKYQKISHALLLKTIYDVKDTTDEEIMPTTDELVEGMSGQEMENPCDRRARIVVPPDSEYCPNYNELP